MNNGIVVQDGTPTDLYFAPNDAYVAELFGPVNRFEGRVEDGQVSCALGTFEAEKFDDGTNVDILVRPDAFKELGPKGMRAEYLPSVTLEVIRARPLGRSSFVLLKLERGQTVEARIPGVFLPDTGEHVRFSISPNQVHIFVR